MIFLVNAGPLCNVIYKHKQYSHVHTHLNIIWNCISYKNIELICKMLPWISENQLYSFFLRCQFQLWIQKVLLIVPTKHLCILVPEPLFLILVPYLQQVSCSGIYIYYRKYTFGTNLHYILCKFSIIIERIGAGTANSKGTI